MRATFFGIEIGKTGVQVSQLGLDVTGHNIANVETKGYTRQRIVSTAYDPYATMGRLMPVSQAFVGGGTRVKILDQIRSGFLDRRYRDENTVNSYWEKRTESFRYLESFFDNVNEETSINFALAKFFEAFKILADDPVEGAPRTQVVSRGEDLVQQLNVIYDGLVDLQSVENLSVRTKVGDINRLAMELVEFNKAIYRFELSGHVANDLRDKRNLVIDDLSTLVDIEYEEYMDDKGAIAFRLWIGNGREEGIVLVDHLERNTLGVREADNVVPDLPPLEKRLIPVWLDEDGDPTDKDLELTGGELKAHIDMRDGDGQAMDRTSRGIPFYIEMLNNLARALVVEMNTVHAQGWTDHPVDKSQTGIRFFNDHGAGSIRYFYDDPANPTVVTRAEYEVNPGNLGNITAKNITLSDEIWDSPQNVAASTKKIVKNGAPEELQAGNNENLNKIYDLFRIKDIVVGDAVIGSFDGFGTMLRFNVGDTLNAAKKAADTSKSLQLAVGNQRMSVSGVSLDEEMTNLIKYQHAYSGASRVITVMDDMLDRLINGTGRVGL